MPKNSIPDWDETPINNEDVGGIDLQENVMRPPAVNNAFREMMAQIKAFFKSTVFRLRDGTDQTKLLALDLSGLTTATTRTATVPDHNFTFATQTQGATIASATTTNLATATGDFVDVSGTTTITGFGTAAAGTIRTVRFTGALTLTHNATSLILYSKSNITTYNGLVMRFRSLGSGNWIEESQTPAVVDFTPTPNFGGGTTGITGTFTGRYTRLGNIVHLNMYLAFTNKGSSTGTFACGGFAPVAKSSPGFWPGAVAKTANFASMLEHTTAWITGGQNAIRLGTSQATAANTFDLSDANFSNTSIIAVSCSFECDP